MGLLVACTVKMSCCVCRECWIRVWKVTCAPTYPPRPWPMQARLSSPTALPLTPLPHVTGCWWCLKVFNWIPGLPCSGGKPPRYEFSSPLTCCCGIKVYQVRIHYPNSLTCLDVQLVHTADSQLLDVSEIQFFNDVDNDIPISGPSDVPTCPAHSIHPQLTGVHSPPLNAAGYRHTTRILQLSTKWCDPCNAEASVPAKCKAGPATSGWRNKCIHVINPNLEGDDHANANADAPSVHSPGTTTDGDENPTMDLGDSKCPHLVECDTDGEATPIVVDMAYTETKDMGDTDQLVSLTLSSLQLALNYILWTGCEISSANWPQCWCVNNLLLG